MSVASFELGHRHAMCPATVPLGSSGLLTAARQLVPIFCLAIIPASFLVALILYEDFDQGLRVAFWDFHAFWGAGRAVLHGHSPYPPARTAVLAHEGSFVYPAPAAIVMVPFALIPFKTAATIFAVILIASLVLALRLVGVTDWRCYGIALFSAPFANSLVLDAIQPDPRARALRSSGRYRERGDSGCIRGCRARGAETVPLALPALVRVHPSGSLRPPSWRSH